VAILLGSPSGGFFDFHFIGGSYGGAAPPLIADFDGDGKPDVLGADANSMTVLWNDPSGFTPGTPFPMGYEVAAAAGDFNGDGKADILWRDANGTVAMWWMNETGIAGYSTVAENWIGWSTAGVIDFDGDRKADILWLDGAGDVAVWLMDGGQRR
jgi:hypothetical protein